MHWNNLWSALLVSTTIVSSVLAKPIPLPGARLNKRDRTPEDAEDDTKVLEWLQEPAQSDIPRTGYVFYSGDAQADAAAFVEAEGNDAYWLFWDIFGTGFERDFGVKVADNDAVAAACSKAMARHAEGDTRVFGDAAALDTSYWKTIEKPALIENPDVANIWSMRAGTTNPDDHPDGNLKFSATPAPTKSLQVYWNELADEISGIQHYWQFYMAQAGTSVDSCGTKPINGVFDHPTDIDEPPSLVQGEWGVRVEDKDCTFQGTGGTGEGGEIGWLHCPDRAAIMCMPDPKPAGNCGIGSTAARYNAVAHCDW